MSAERIADLLRRPAAGGAVAVEGWLRSARHAKDLSFLAVNDGSSLAGLQAVVAPDVVPPPVVPSFRQAALHPSPSVTLPSSQDSSGSGRPSPHTPFS